MQNGVRRLVRRERLPSESSYLSQQIGDTEAITVVHFVRSVILLLTFAAFAFVLFGRDLKIIALTVAIGWLLIVLTKAWRRREDH